MIKVVHMILFREEKKKIMVLENWEIIFLSSDSPQVTQLMVHNQYTPAFKSLAWIQIDGSDFE